MPPAATHVRTRTKLHTCTPPAPTPGMPARRAGALCMFEPTGVPPPPAPYPPPARIPPGGGACGIPNPAPTTTSILVITLSATPPPAGAARRVLRRTPRPAPPAACRAARAQRQGRVEPLPAPRGGRGHGPQPRRRACGGTFPFALLFAPRRARAPGPPQQEPSSLPRPPQPSRAVRGLFLPRRRPAPPPLAPRRRAHGGAGRRGATGAR
ncbi:MAG: hypothetical protein J3K34DRAFT_106228 [Monoraphidium minutum]|nr:MAG: hypothetical protein J3K34DRAFT_106228 [Monoraphidium minutum]